MRDANASIAREKDRDALLGDTIDSLGEGVQILDQDWRYQYLNDAAAAHGRRPKEDLLGRTLLECYPGIEHTAVFGELDRCMRERCVSELENEFEYEDGTRRWFELRISPCREGLLILSLDISNRKSLEAALQQSNDELRKAYEQSEDTIRERSTELRSLLNRYQALCNAIPDLVLRMDSDCRYLDFHPGDQVKLAFPPEVFIGRKPGDLFELEIAEATEKHIREALETGQMQVWEYQLSFDGKAFHYEARIVPSGGNEIVAFIRDITESKRIQEQLRRSESRLRTQNAELALRDRNKDLFLSTLGHELRNPLGAIKNSLDLISLLPAGRAGDGERMVAIHILQRQSDQLVRIVDDLLDLERIKHGKLELRLDNVDLVRLANEVIGPYGDRADGLGLAFNFSYPKKPLYVRADPARLRQVFQNLLDNALRFTQEGEVAISVRKGAENAEVVIRDTGVGFDPEEAASIFDPYYQSDAAKSVPGGSLGLGFGLALVKNILERHGGTIEAYSSGLGNGAAFTFSIPLVEAVSTESQGTSTIKKPPCHRILVVDDERDNARAFGALLEQLGQEISIAYDGASALQIAGAQHPDIAFVDLAMPGMDGRELAQRLRETFPPKDLVLVAVTGLPQSAGRAERKDPDFSHYLLKPVKLEAVVKLLNSITPPEECEMVRRLIEE